MERSRWSADIQACLLAHTGLGGLVGVYLLIALSLGGATGDIGRVTPWLYNSRFNIVMAIFAVLFLAFVLTALSVLTIHVICIERPSRPFDHIIRRIRARYMTRRQMFGGIVVVVLLSVFGSVFTSLKTMIPLLHPYDWDAALMGWDAELAFGVAPWLWLQPIVGFPVVTAILDCIYGSWLFVLAGCWVWQAFACQRPALRSQFFATYFLSFAILGNVAATWLASGGPCYYGRLVRGEDPYMPLMAYLRHVVWQTGIGWSVMVQDMLWTNYRDGLLVEGAGISAMPSMHVGGAVLCALLGWQYGKLIGITLTIYTATIMVGSVHLGWHYAVDGYFSALGTMAIWWLVGAWPSLMASVKPDNRRAP